MLKGDIESFGVFFTWEIEVLAKVKGDAKNVHSLKGEGTKRYTLGGGKKFQTHNFPIL